MSGTGTVWTGRWMRCRARIKHMHLKDPSGWKDRNWNSLPWKWGWEGDTECNNIKHKNIKGRNLKNSELIEMGAQN